jgi:tetratricopeptide (TPR) repeat protein
VNRYNNIAYYLQKAGHNQEAIFLLEEILSEFPKRVVAYLNLGDAYWDETKRVKALNNYHHYVKLMKKEQKEKRIPSYVLKRIEESKDFSKGFIEKYKEVQTLAPIFLKEMKETKPLEIVPWMQKTILTVEKENGLLVNVLAYEKDDDVEIVYFVQTLMEKENRDEDIEYAKGKIIMYKFSFKERDITTLSLYDSTILLGKKGFDGTTLDGWTFYNLQEFILDKGYLYFDVKSCESKKGSNHIDAFCYKSKYRFGDNNITDSNDYMTKNWYKRWNHKHDTFVYSGDSFNIGQIENNKTVTKSLFTIKSFKNKIIREESIPFTIGGVSWSEDDKVLYFDNHDIELACIWRYDLESKELSKIVPEHEAQQPFAFTFRASV